MSILIPENNLGSRFDAGGTASYENDAGEASLGVFVG